MAYRSSLAPYLAQIETWRAGGLYHREIAERLIALGVKTNRKSVQIFCKRRNIQMAELSERRLPEDALAPQQVDASCKEEVAKPKKKLGREEIERRMKEQEEAKLKRLRGD